MVVVGGGGVVNLKFTTLLLSISPTASEFLPTALGLTSWGGGGGGGGGGI